MQLQIGVIRGDGIGPEIVEMALATLHEVAKGYGHTIQEVSLLLGGASIDVHGVPLTDETIQKAKSCDAILMGSIGGDAKTSPWYQLKPELRPEAGLLKIRKELGLYANLRPAVLYDALHHASPLKEERIVDGFDFLILRELTGGLYFGEHTLCEKQGERVATDELTYWEHEIARIASRAFELARTRKGKVTSVDKANVLASSRLWRSVVDEVAKDYPDVTYEHMLVDACAMQLVHSPAQFDVILTENMFGDILSDEASMVAGSIGMLPSASLGEGHFGLYEPSGGSAPDLAGKDVANPLATILSAAMLLRHSFGLEEEASAIEQAVEDVLDAGYRTADIWTDGQILVGTKAMGEKVCEAICKHMQQKKEKNR
jgi:3-isopropylmalate dehydrogenase